jgi:hypothetical protein
LVTPGNRAAPSPSGPSHKSPDTSRHDFPCPPQIHTLAARCANPCEFGSKGRALRTGAAWTADPVGTQAICMPPAGASACPASRDRSSYSDSTRRVICAGHAIGGNYRSQSRRVGIDHRPGRCRPCVPTPPLASPLTRSTTWGQAIAGAGNRRVLRRLIQRAWPMAANVDLAPALALSRTSSFAPPSVDDEPNQPVLSCR